MGRKRSQLKEGTAGKRGKLHIRVGRPWDGKLEVEVRRFMLLTRLSWSLVVLLGALALQMLVNNDTGLAHQLASLVHDALLIVVGGLARSVRREK